MLAYIQRACVIAHLLVSTGFRRVAVRLTATRWKPVLTNRRREALFIIPPSLAEKNCIDPTVRNAASGTLTIQVWQCSASEYRLIASYFGEFTKLSRARAICYTRSVYLQFHVCYSVTVKQASHWHECCSRNAPQYGVPRRAILHVVSVKTAR